MTTVLAPQGDHILLDPAPCPPSVPPGIALALADREFCFDGSAAWNPEWAMTASTAAGHTDDLAPMLATLQTSACPVPFGWLGDRLSLLWVMFMASRTSDNEALTVWMAEYARLLGDLPHDIVATSIDGAVRRAKHGFIPSVGEIRAIADPLADARNQQIRRLQLTVDYLAGERGGRA